MREYIVKQFSEVKDACQVWDEHIEKRSVNGTFLQSMKFMGYHPHNRFQNNNLFMYDNGKIVALIPGCDVYDGQGKCFFSHKGSTFGGPIISNKYYSGEKVIHILNTLEEYLRSEGYSKVILKPTNRLFSIYEPDLLTYCLAYSGYTVYHELSTYVDLVQCPESVLNIFDRNKMRNIRKCDEVGLVFRSVDTDEDVLDFYKLLRKNLEKYGLKPIHSYEEILDLYHNRVNDNIRFYGVYDNDIMMAGGMMFLFPNTNTIHAQNLSADYEFKEYSAITYLYYKIIDMAKKEGFEKLSWGISTEDRGKVLNYSLLRNKESYGSKYCLNYIYEKCFRK